MKQTIPFEHDIVFKTKIGEITSIALDNDLVLKGEDLIVGNFYINGTYKILKTSTIEEEYSYKLPCEIAISDDYDTYECSIDIDDFVYEIVNDEILKVHIVVLIDNLVKKEKVVVEEVVPVIEKLDRVDVLEEDNREIIDPLNVISDAAGDMFFSNNSDNYLTYSVYVVSETDTVESILKKYKITKEQLLDYNTFDTLFPGMKLVIPSFISND